MLCSPDAGGVKRCQEMASYLKTEIIIVDKRPNIATGTVEAVGIIGNCAGRDVVIFDDILDTCHSFSDALSWLKREGAKRIVGAITHPICSGTGFEELA